MAFQVSKSSHNSRTKHYFANPRKCDSYLHFIDPWAAVAVYTHTHTNTLPYTSLVHAHRAKTTPTCVVTKGAKIEIRGWELVAEICTSIRRGSRNWNWHFSENPWGAKQLNCSEFNYLVPYIILPLSQVSGGETGQWREYSLCWRLRAGPDQNGVCGSGGMGTGVLAVPSRDTQEPPRSICRRWLGCDRGLLGL